MFLSLFQAKWAKKMRFMIFQKEKMPITPSALGDHANSTGHNLKWDHFEILATGRTQLPFTIKETIFIHDLQPSLNEYVSNEKFVSLLISFAQCHIVVSLFYSFFIQLQYCICFLCFCHYYLISYSNYCYYIFQNFKLTVTSEDVC